MILVSYDGSPDAQAAIDHVARLMPGAPATVLTVWEPYVQVVAAAGAGGFGMGMMGPTDLADGYDERAEQVATATATEGAERATAAGLRAVPLASSRHRGVPATVLAAAADVDADVIVLGTRGRGGLTSLLMGSVSHAVTQHADRPVLVIPSEEVAAHRRAWIDHEAVPA